MARNYLTQERHDEIEKELDDLKKHGRLNVAERLKQSKDLGDLSENSDYMEAREEQARLETRIAELDDLLRSSAIIRRTEGSGAVRVGSKVKVKKDGVPLEYIIVGSSESSPAQGLISNESPVGRELLGKKIGDRAQVQTPKGEVVYEIEGIE
ncbi:MAG: transcription elongation factor GreA [Candidatus Jorgensenbacteria bacterium]|nr:transcription elongation factor GreA [Candidatus Jorgensenbacteria bacterium]